MQLVAVNCVETELTPYTACCVTRAYADVKQSTQVRIVACGRCRARTAVDQSQLLLSTAMVVCQHALQGTNVVHFATAPSRRPWRTSSALRRDRDEQQLQRLSCKSCRCRAVHAAAIQSQDATLRQETDQGIEQSLVTKLRAIALP